MEGCALVTGMNWIADYAGMTVQEVAVHERIRSLARAQQQRLDSPTDPARSESVAPAAPRRVDPAPLSRPPAENPSRAISGDPVNALSLALDAAIDDTTRAALLAAAPKGVRDQLAARLRYLAFMRPTEDAYDAFERALSAARDDAARRALIAGRDAAFLAEWAWRARATSEVWRKHYLAMVAGDGES
jgi:hypothetical protein